MHLPKYYMAETKAIFNENIILLFFGFCIYLKSLTAITCSKISSPDNSIKYWVSLLQCLLSTLNKWFSIGLKLSFGKQNISLATILPYQISAPFIFSKKTSEYLWWYVQIKSIFTIWVSGTTICSKSFWWYRTEEKLGKKEKSGFIMCICWAKCLYEAEIGGEKAEFPFPRTFWNFWDIFVPKM